MNQGSQVCQAKSRVIVEIFRCLTSHSFPELPEGNVWVTLSAFVDHLSHLM
eukprot:m.505084 g.505084  ORF g.505084 m.505084 type:complete len:51 (+) comp280674_c0_seq1:69-221(+)